MAHLPGTFCWTDLAAPDLETAERFYGDLFGWTAEAAGPPEQTGGYSFFRLDDRLVGAFGSPGPGEPPSWRPYVCVESADHVASLAREAGGKLLLEPMDVFAAGRMTVFSDPAGAVCCAWQPKELEGIEASGEPNALGWVELATREVDDAKSFYRAVLGWDTREMPGGYNLWTLNGKEIGGLSDMERHPPEVPPHWLVSFVSADTDATAARAAELGGEVRAEPMTIEIPDRPNLRFATVADPNGAMFGVFTGLE